MVELCHSGPKLCWHRTRFGNIGRIMLIVSCRICRAPAKLSYWGWIRGSKCEKFAYCLWSLGHDRCTNIRDILYFCRQIYWPSRRLKMMSKFDISTFCWQRSTSKIWKAAHCSWSTSEIWKAAHCFEALNCNRQTKIFDTAQILKKCSQASFLIQGIPKCTKCAVWCYIFDMYFWLYISYVDLSMSYVPYSIAYMYDCEHSVYGIFVI